MPIGTERHVVFRLTPFLRARLDEPGKDCRGVRTELDVRLTVHVPLGDQAIGRDTRVERIGPFAVHVIDVTPGRRAQPGQVEMGIARLERVERPGDQADRLGPGEIALEDLDLVAQAPRLVAGHHTRQLRVKAEPALDATEEGERHRDRLAARQERAEDQPAVQVGPDHGRDRDQVAVLGDPPRPSLGVLAGAIVGDRLGPSDRDLVVEFQARRGVAS